MATPQERLIAWWKAQVGYAASPGKWNKYAAYMDSLGMYNGPKNGYDWCDVTYDCGIAQTFGPDMVQPMLNQPKGGCGAGCEFSAQYYKDMGRWSHEPSLGAQIFFGNYDHTGCVVGYNDGVVHTIEGNTGYGSGYSGGAVLEHTYDRGSAWIAGYGTPRWELAEEDEMTETDFQRIKKMIEDNNKTIAWQVWAYKYPKVNGTKDAYALLTEIPKRVWSFRNKEVETRDAYQILRDIRTTLGIEDGQTLNEYCVTFAQGVITKIASALGIKH